MSNKNDFFIVGIGASAGGLDAIRDFFQNISTDTNMAFVVIQHLSPDYKSLMGELISKFTSMQVQKISDGVELVPNNIYVIPPKKNVTISNNKLKLEESVPHNVGINLPINIFFKSLSKEKKKRAVAIILSGTGSDGSKGIKDIKQEGGLIIVQDPFESKFDGMPRNAISVGIADHILKSEEMGKVLLNYINHPYIKGDSEEESKVLNKVALIKKILEIIYRERDVDFSQYKEKTIIRRIEKRIGMTKSDDYNQYLEFIYSNPEEIDKLYYEMLIGVTEFFRDEESFKFVRDDVIPSIINKKDNEEELRLWSVGCSTGQEAYSLAILCKEYLKLTGKHIPMKIFATDIDQESLEIAGRGIFLKTAVEELPKDIVDKYFIQVEDKYQVIKEIRESIVFAIHNISNDPPFNNIDLISCRNLLIYFDIPLQKRVFQIFNFALINSGFLFLGKSESIGDSSDIFKAYNQKFRVFRSIKSNSHKLSESIVINSNLNTRNMRALTPIKSKNKKSLTQKEKLNEILLKKHIPSCVIVNSDEKIVHIYGNAKDYFIDFSGEVDFNVQNIFPGELASAISLGVYKVLSTNERIIYKKIHLNKTGKEQTIDIKITPIKIYDTQENYVEIDFINLKDFDEEVKEIPLNGAETTNQKITSLENELQDTREDLQTTLEELETSNEELQATNEELLASNEELQSTNEELQSVNEELLTVNSEYQMKNEELQKLNDDIDNLLKSTEIGTVFLDTSLYIRKFTPAATSEINFIASDIGRPISDISHNLKDTDLESEVREVLSNLQPKEQEVQNKNGDYFLLRILPFFTNDGNAEGVVLTFIKITDLIEAKRDIKQNETIFNRVINNSPIGICITDENGNYVDVNDAYAKMYGYDRSELIGNHFTVIVPEKHKQDLDNLNNKFFENHEELEGDWEVQNKSGDILNIRANAIYIENHDREPRKVTFLTDITKYKNLENSLRIAKENAEKSNEYKSLFLANMTHEIRTPMNGIMGTLEFLKETKLDDEQREFLDMMQTSSSYLLEIINNILDISKIEQGKLLLKESEFNILNLIDEVLSIFKTGFRRKNLQLEYSKNGGFKYRIVSDYIRLKQVLMNLISNAIKFTDDGIISVEINEIEVTKDEVELLISIKDTGCGISELDKQYIFDVFNQGDITSTKQYQGTGLGLTLVKRIIEVLGGEIFLESRKGKGSTFSFDVTFKIANENKNYDLLSKYSRKPVMLIVDDNEINKLMMEKILKRIGVETKTAKNGKEAVEMFKEEKFDMVFMDLQMPIMNGYEATEAIRLLDENSEVPIVAVTAYSERESRNNCLEIGMDDFLNKPVNLDKIKAVIEKYLEI